MLSNDSGNSYLVPDLNISLLGVMFVGVSGRNPLSKKISFFFPSFPSFAESFQEGEFRLEQHYRPGGPKRHTQNTPLNNRIGTFFSRVPGTFSGIDHIVGHKTKC